MPAAGSAFAVVSWSSYPLKNVACPPRDEGHLQPQPNEAVFFWPRSGEAGPSHLA